MGGARRMKGKGEMIYITPFNLKGKICKRKKRRDKKSTISTAGLLQGCSFHPCSVAAQQEPSCSLRSSCERPHRRQHRSLGNPSGLFVP